jgi:hypothetical protein
MIPVLHPQEKGTAMKTALTLVASLAALGGCASAATPEAISPSTGEKLAFVAPARGVQIYECRAGEWAFVAPDAQLFDAAGKTIGRHYAGPHWEAADGSKVVAAVKAKADAPSAGDLPWLLLSAKSVGAEGAFSKITSIQRLATVGGIAPSRSCENGARARVGYTADYYFFTAR